MFLQFTIAEDGNSVNKCQQKAKYEPDYVAIGKRIRNARKSLGLSQEKVCELTDLSPSHMSHIESGKTKVSLPSLILIANALETTVDALLHDNVIITADAYDKDFKDLLSDCTLRERQCIYVAATHLKEALKK